MDQKNEEKEIKQRKEETSFFVAQNTNRLLCYMLVFLSKYLIACEKITRNKILAVILVMSNIEQVKSFYLS